MSDQPQEVPLVELLRVPEDARGEYPMLDSEGNRYGTHMIPFGHHMNRAADEITRLQAELDKYKQFLKQSHENAGKTIESYVIASDVIKDQREKLRKENAELKQQLIDVDYVPSISELRRKNEGLQAQLDEAKDKLKSSEWFMTTVAEELKERGFDTDGKAAGLFVGLSEIMGQLDEAKDKLRWRKWPDEKPKESQLVLIEESVYQYVCDDFGGEAWQEADCGEIYDCEGGDLWLPIPDTQDQG